MLFLKHGLQTRHTFTTKTYLKEFLIHQICSKIPVQMCCQPCGTPCSGRAPPVPNSASFCSSPVPALRFQPCAHHHLLHELDVCTCSLVKGTFLLKKVIYYGWATAQSLYEKCFSNYLTRLQFCFLRVANATVFTQEIIYSVPSSLLF